METLWFLEDKHLCIADPTLVLKIPLNAFKRIVRINKKAMVLYWNKDKNINAPEYKEYKLKTNAYGMVFENHITLWNYASMIKIIISTSLTMI